MAIICLMFSFKDKLIQDIPIANRYELINKRDENHITALLNATKIKRMDLIREGDETNLIILLWH